MYVQHILVVAGGDPGGRRGGEVGSKDQAAYAQLT